MTHVYAPRGAGHALETAGAWLLGFLWLLPLLYAVWTAFHPAEFSTRFALTAPLTLENFEKAWIAAPFARYFVNTMALVAMVLAGSLAGLALGLIAERWIASLLFNVKGTDLIILLAPALALMAAALLAALPPVARAIRIDPAQTLRSE